MELEFFCAPGEDLQWFAYWKDYCHQWLLSLGMNKENLRLRDHAKEELSHYSKPQQILSSCSVRLGRALGRRRQDGF